MASRGRPRGRRNLAWAGTGLGNGGVAAPGHYQRRRGCLGPDNNHDAFWLSDWRRLLDHLRQTGAISPNAHAVGNHLAGFSNERAEHTWPSQATVGARMDRSPSTARRAMAELRAAGVLEWDHRFEGPTNEIPRPHPTSNMYEFRIPLELARAANLKRRIQRMTKRRPPRRPSHHNGSTGAPAPQPTLAERQRRQHQSAIESFVSAQCLLVGARYDETVEAIENMYAGSPEDINFATEALTLIWRRRAGP